MLLQALRAPAEQAFNCIFALLARREKHLRPADIQELQYRVFQQHITASELDILMEQILNVTQKGSSTVQLSRESFHTFILSFLARKRAEPVWHILRYYGYDTQLSLAKTYLHPRLAVAPDGSESVELSEAGLSFVAQIWEDFHNEVGLRIC